MHHHLLHSHSPRPGVAISVSKAVPRNAIIEDAKFYSCGFAETGFENFKKQPMHVQDEPREHSKLSNDDLRSRHDHLPSDLLC